MKVVNPWYLEEKDKVENAEGKGFDSRQANKFMRRNCNVKAFKILDVSGKNLILRLPAVFGKNRTMEIPVAKPESYSIGKYVDIILIYTIDGGVASSYKAEFLGKTPEQFIPENGEEIGTIVF